MQSINNKTYYYIKMIVCLQIKAQDCLAQDGLDSYNTTRCFKRVNGVNKIMYPKNFIQRTGRAGYRSKIVNTDTDTLSSIPVPERYFFRYQFNEISFNKITLSQKTLFLFFSACWHLYRLKDSSPEPLHKGTKYIQHNKSVQIILIKFK